MITHRYRLTMMLVAVLLSSISALGQVDVSLPCQSDGDASDPAFTDAVIDLDRKDFNGGSTAIHSQGYLHNFTLPANTFGPCKAISNVEVEITAIAANLNLPPNCFVGPYYTNMYYQCGALAPASCDFGTNGLGEPFSPTFNNQVYNFTMPPVGLGTTFDFGGVVSIDLVPVASTGCAPDWQQYITQGYVDLDYDICVTVTIIDLAINTPVDLGPPSVNICAGTTTPLDAGSYSSYAWDPNGETSQIINVGDGTYTVTVTDINGCTDTDEVTVTEDSPTVSITSSEVDLTVCPGEMTTLTAVHNGSTVRWNTTETTTTISVGQGAYDVTVTDVNNCTALATINIGQHTPPTVTIDPANATVCDNGTTTIGVLENGLQYDWSTTESTQTITVGPGSYMVTVTDGNGCSSVASTNVTNITSPFAGSDNTIDVCNDGQTYDLFALLGGADPGGLWVDQDGSTVNVNTDPSAVDFTGVIPGTYVFRYEIVATAPCITSQAFITVEVYENLLAGADYNDQICLNSFDYDLEALLGIYDPGGTWVDLDGSNVNLTNPNLVDFTGVQADVYRYAYEHGATLGCNGSDAIATIEILESANAGADDGSTICTGTTLNLVNLLSFDADLSGVFNSTSSAVVGDQFVSGNVGPGLYTVTYVVTSLVGFCPSDTASFVIEVSNSVSAGLDTLFLACDTSTVALVNLLNDADLGGSFTPTSSTAGFANDSVFVADLPAGTYSYEYVVGDNQGCPSDTSAIIVDVPNQPTVSLANGDITLCSGACEDITFANTGDSIPTLTVYLLNNQSVIVDSIIIDISTGVVTLSVCETLGTTGIENDTVFVGIPSGLTITSAVSEDSPCNDLAIDTISITTVSAIVTTIDTNLCPSDTLVLGGQIFTGQDVSRRDTLSGIACDSIVNIDINIVDADTIFIQDVLCFEDTLRLGSGVYTATNTSDTLVNVTSSGCDSITIVDLTFRDEISTLVDDSLCEGDSIVVNSIVYNSDRPSGTEVLTSAMLCDSTVIIDLTFGSDVALVFDDTLCVGQSIVVSGTTYDINNPSASFVIPAPGCDTSVTVDLTFAVLSSDTIRELVCSDFVLAVGSDIYNISSPRGSSVISSLVAPFCDSTVVVDLTYRAVAEQTVDTILCNGETLPVGPDLYDINMLTGTTLLPGLGAGGCDSMVMVSITYESVYNDTIFTTLCMGDSVLVGGVWQFDSGDYPESFVSINGCDSMITTSVEVLNCSVMVSVSSDDIECAGTSTGSIAVDILSPIDPPFEIEISSTTLTPRVITIQSETGNASFDNLPSGFYTIEITDANGVVVYSSTLTITEPVDPVSVTAFVIDAPTCEVPVGDVLATATGGATPYTYLWSNGGDNPQQEGLVPDTYVVTVTDNSNCTATSEIVIDASGDVQAVIEITDPSCTGLADGVISVTDFSGGQEPYVVLINEVALLSDSLINLTDGAYNIVIFDAQRCTLETMVMLESETILLFNDFEASYEISAGDSVEIALILDPTATGLGWSSTDESGDCLGCTSFVVAPTMTTTYEVVATNADGCQEVVSVTVIVDTPFRTQANIFSPNGDSVNEDFVVYAVPGSVSNTLFVYDRWGNTVLSKAVAGNTNSWDGNNNGTPVVNGVYLYVLNSALLDGRTEQEMGQVTVLR